MATVASTPFFHVEWYSCEVVFSPSHRLRSSEISLSTSTRSYERKHTLMHLQQQHSRQVRIIAFMKANKGPIPKTPTIVAKINALRASLSYLSVASESDRKIKRVDPERYTSAIISWRQEVQLLE